MLTKIFRNILVVLAALLMVSCALDELGNNDSYQEGEAVVMTFKPRFEDFETVTKAIGDGTQVDKLLVQVYEGDSLVNSEEYDKDEWSNIAVSFLYGKTYNVYFWAYNSEEPAYTISKGGLKSGVTVNYPGSTDALAYDSLEYLDAFYAVETINLSDDVTDNTSPSLTRPFAQVNLVADKTQLETAKAAKVEFTINVADSFVPGISPTISTSKTFTFTISENFENNELITDTNNVYLGTTYLFVPSTGSLAATVTLYDSMNNKLKGPTDVTITLATNQRTNLVFTGVEPAWSTDGQKVPAADGDGWIHITKPEELAALLLSGTTAAANVHICNDIDMGGMPADVVKELTGKSFTDLTLDGTTDEGYATIKNFTAPAFIGTATKLKVSNLVFDNVNVSNTTGHIGTLVNTLKGSSSFTNVTVSNSSATTTNGAAGGIVGYIERIAPTTRSEELNVPFNNCHVNGAADKPVADGSDAEGKFVGLLKGYDYRETLQFDEDCSATNTTNVTDYMSRYTDGYQAEWLESNDYSTFSGFLGDEVDNRGTINLGNNQFVPMWDGLKTVKPLSAEEAYDGWSSGTVIYSAFDLAYLQGLSLKTEDGNYYLCADVDLGGDGTDGQVGKLDKDRNMQECGADDALFKSINYIANFNGVKKDKIGTALTSLTEADNHSIYNCKVVLNKHDGYGAGFIKQVTGTTNHNNINLVRAYVYNHHDEDLPEQKYYENDNGSGNAYAGTFVSTTGGTYNISNVHVSNGHVMAVCKIGGIIGRVGGVLNMSNCSVHNHTVENWDANIINWYPKAMSLSSSMMVYVNQSWYTQGECGGLIGFIKSTSALIDNCSVTDTDINCTGQPDKQVTAGVYMSGWTSIEAAGPNPKGDIKGYTIIAGRHVNQFIGDVVSERSEARANTSDYTVTIKDYYVSGNRYFGTPVTNARSVTLPESKDQLPRTISYNPNPTSHAYGFSTTTRDVDHWWGKTPYYTNTVDSFCNCVGSAYYVGVDVYVDIWLAKIETHVMDCAGTLTFNEKGKAAVTLTEAIKSGNSISWTGGDFWMQNEK